VVVDRAAGTVSLPAGLRYGELAEALHAEGVALANLASLPHISVGGRWPRPPTAPETPTATWPPRSPASSWSPPPASCSPPGGATPTSTAWSSGWVSVFTRWGEVVDQVWVKRRVTGDPEPEAGSFFGATPATVDQHPIRGIDPANCTPQLGVPGRWSDRLPHFRMGFMPSSGEELQSEFFVPRRDAAGAIGALRALAGVVRPVLQVSELRTVAADELWMSPQYRRDSLAVHFTWRPDRAAVDRVLVDVEAALAPFGARPHWGKVFRADATTIAPLYERLADFARMAERLDRRGAFANPWLRTRVLGG
jgi:alditol oxidase